MKRTIIYAALALMLSLMACITTATPTSPGSGGGGGVPYGYNQKSVDGASGTSSIPVQCDSANGDILIPGGAFSGTQTISIECISPSEMSDLDAKVKQQTGQSNQALGAIRFEPSPFNFNKDVTIVIPLIQQRTDLANKYVDLYVYAPNVSGDLRYVKQAKVDSQGRTATAKVNHFSTFLLVNPGESAEPPPTDAPDEFTCEDPLGCVTFAPGEPLLIASMLDFSGQENFSNAVLKGIDTAISDYGTIQSHPIENVSVDSGCSQEEGANAAYQVTGNSQFAGVVGTICSGSALGAMPILADAGYVMVSPSNTRTALTHENHYPGYFRVSLPDAVQAYFMAEFAYRELGLQYVAVYRDEDLFNTAMAEAFRDHFEELGGKIAAFSTVPSYDTDMFFALTNSLQAEGAQAVYMALTMEHAATFTVYMREFGLDFPLMGTEVLNSSDYFDGAGISTYNVYFTEPRPTNTSDPYAFGYDAARLLLDAIANISLSEEDGTLHIGRQALRDIMFQISFEGKTGTIECYDNGDCGHSSIMIYIIKEGAAADVARYTP